MCRWWKLLGFYLMVVCLLFESRVRYWLGFLVGRKVCLV